MRTVLIEQVSFRDSPVAAKASPKMLISVCVRHQWTVATFF